MFQYYQYSASIDINYIHINTDIVNSRARMLISLKFNLSERNFIQKCYLFSFLFLRNLVYMPANTQIQELSRCCLMPISTHCKRKRLFFKLNIRLNSSLFLLSTGGTERQNKDQQIEKVPQILLWRKTAQLLQRSLMF